MISLYRNPARTPKSKPWNFRTETSANNSSWTRNKSKTTPWRVPNWRKRSRTETPRSIRTWKIYQGWKTSSSRWEINLRYPLMKSRPRMNLWLRWARRRRRIFILYSFTWIRRVWFWGRSRKCFRFLMEIFYSLSKVMRNLKSLSLIKKLKLKTSISWRIYWKKSLWRETIFQRPRLKILRSKLRLSGISMSRELINWPINSESSKRFWRLKAKSSKKSSQSKDKTLNPWTKFLSIIWRLKRVRSRLKLRLQSSWSKISWAREASRSLEEKIWSDVCRS